MGIRPRSTLGAAALEHVRRGRPVFPCRPGEKRPATAHGFQDASVDPDQVSEWWARMPMANIGMPTGTPSVDVLDVDVRNGGDGWRAFERLRGAGLLRGASAMVQTRSGGIHVYFRAIGQRSASLPGQFLDLKADGGYVLVPPSRVSPAGYELLEERSNATGTLDWSAVRRVLASPVAKRVHRPLVPDGHQIDRLARWLSSSSVREGNRNRALYWSCRRAGEAGICTIEGLAPLIDIAIELGLSVAEANSTARSALNSHGGGA